MDAMLLERDADLKLNVKNSPRARREERSILLLKQCESESVSESTEYIGNVGLTNSYRDVAEAGQLTAIDR
jgi:hypothetical protein